MLLSKQSLFWVEKRLSSPNEEREVAEDLMKRTSRTLRDTGEGRDGASPGPCFSDRIKASKERACTVYANTVRRGEP